MRELKEKVYFFTPIVALMLMTCAATYANIPTRSIVDDVYVSSDSIYVTDDKLNQWRLVPDCTIPVDSDDHVSVSVRHKVIKQGTPITITNNGQTQQCKLTSYSRL